MEIDIVELFNDELMMLNWMVDKFGIPDEVFREHGSSSLMMRLDEHRDLGRPREANADEKLHSDITELGKKGKESFECLCQSVPHIPRNAIRDLSLAYGTYVVITKDYRDGIQTEFNQSDVRALFAVTMLRGSAMGIVGMAGGNMLAIMDEAQRKKRLSEAGLNGALVRLKPYAALKAWALEKGKELPANKDTARKLEDQLPAHLFDVSKDPGRLIYETLLNRDKPS